MTPSVITYSYSEDEILKMFAAQHGAPVKNITLKYHFEKVDERLAGHLMVSRIDVSVHNMEDGNSC